MTTNKKTPYELRYDLLDMVKEMFDKQYEVNKEVAYKAMELYKDNAEEALKAWAEHAPVMPSPEDIKKSAETLYDFVMNKGDRSNETFNK